jgi:CheY-like chemotaxis protein
VPIVRRAAIHFNVIVISWRGSRTMRTFSAVLPNACRTNIPEIAGAGAFSTTTRIVYHDERSEGSLSDADVYAKREILRFAQNDRSRKRRQRFQTLLQTVPVPELRLTSPELGLPWRCESSLKKGGSILKRGTVLLIEDSPKDQQIVQDVLHAQGYSVTTISDAERAFSTVEDWAKQYNFVIIQEAMRGRSGMELVHAARLSCKDLPVLVVTRDGDWNGYAQALSEGVVDYFPTPVDRKKLVRAVAGALTPPVL